MKRAVLLFAALGLCSSALAEVVWRGDFETGNTSQFSGQEIKAPDRLQVVQSPVREGTYSLKATVKQGDSVVGSGHRNELLADTYEPAGSEYFYKWSTFFPKDFPKADTWQVFMQWHHTGCCGSPPVEFYIRNDTLHLRTGGADGPVHWTAPLVRDQWTDFVFRVKWHSDPKVGFVELWHNGQLVLPKTGAVTQYKGETNYLKLGLYRDTSISAVGTVFHDGLTQATTLADVMPPPPPPPVVAPEPPPVVASPEPPAPTEELPEAPPVVSTPQPEPTASAPSPAPATALPPGLPQPVVAPEVFPSDDESRSGPLGCNSVGGATGLGGALFALLGLRRRRRKA